MFILIVFPHNRPILIYQLLGGFVFICMYYLVVFYDQSDDIVEYIWGILAEFATNINVISTPPR